MHCAASLSVSLRRRLGDDWGPGCLDIRNQTLVLYSPPLPFIYSGYAVTGSFILGFVRFQHRLAIVANMEGRGLRQQPGFACEECRRRKARCDRGRPKCGFCTETGTTCVIVDKRQQRGPKKGQLNAMRSQIGSFISVPVMRMVAFVCSHPFSNHPFALLLALSMSVLHILIANRTSCLPYAGNRCQPF